MNIKMVKYRVLVKVFTIFRRDQYKYGKNREKE